MTELRKDFSEAMQAVNGVVLGKKKQVRLAFAALLAGGHLLIEDLPGVGKTVLVQALAKVCGLTFQRLQFTSDLLPADIIGAVVYERQKELFTFRPGPLFAQLVLADEVNRATPRTQSALLEALEEHRVTVDGQTYDLPEPFFVIATQNPAHQIGTYPFPDLIARVCLNVGSRRPASMLPGLCLIIFRNFLKVVVNVVPFSEACRPGPDLLC